MSQNTQTIQNIDIRPLFGLSHVPTPVYLNGFAEPGPDTPDGNPDYVWQRGHIQDMVTFFRSGEIALQAIGHAGTGKSSFIEEFHNRLNLPLYTYNAHPRTEAGDLIGKFSPTPAGGLVFTYGPVARAAMEGRSVLIDEYNVIDPGEATGLNALLEGRSIFIPEIGDWIRPKESFRVFTAINPKTVGYVGRNTQDAANDDRFRFMYFDYMPEDQEISLIKSVLLSSGMKDEAMAIRTATCYREVAAAVRKAYMGTSDDANALDVTLSTRSLVRWAKYTMACAGVSNTGFKPVHYALERSKTLKASPETRMAIHEMVHQVFGEEYRTPLTVSTSV